MSAAQVSAAPAERRGWGAEEGGPAVNRPRESEGSRQPELGEEAAEESGRRRPVVEAPPPKENPWTRRRAARDSPSPPSADGQLGPEDPELQNFTKVIKAAKPRTRKSSKADDFGDITNWPTPSEIASNECKTTSHSKKTTNKREKEEKTDQKSNNGIKDNSEAKPDGPGDNTSEDEAQTNNQRKKDPEDPCGLDLLIFLVEPLFGMCEKFLQEVDSFQRCFIAELPHMQGSFVDKLLDLMPRLVTSKPSEVVKILQTTLRQSTFLHLPLPEQLHRATANIIEPTGESDNPLRFTSGLVVALDVDATLEHVQDPQGTVKVQVLYPDGQAQIIHPKPADFRNPGPGRHRLITQVYLSHTAWTEPCQIEVRLLLAYNSNRSKASAKMPKSTWSENLEALPQSENGIEGTIPFSKPVKVYIMPKPARR